MNCCYKIEVCNPCEGVPQHFLTETGSVFLDVSTATDIEILKSKGELTDINQIKIDAILDISIPKSDLNETVLGHFFCFGALDRNTEPLEVLFIVSGEIMPFRFMSVTDLSDDGCSFNVRISYEGNHWATAANDCKLCDIEDIEDFPLFLENIQSTWNNTDGSTGPRVWQSGDPVYMFPPVEYGVGISEANNYRPWFSVPGLMKALFKKIGWKLDAPILDTYFADKWMYLSPEDYGEPKGVDLEQFKFFASTDAGFHNGGIFQLDEVFDNSGVYANPNYIGNNSLEEELCVDFSFFDASFATTLRIIKTDQNNDRTIVGQYDFESLSSDPQGRQLMASFCTPCGANDSNCTYHVESNFNGNYEYVKFYNRPKRFRYNNGTVIQMQETLDCECTLLDLLKGVLHFFDGKLETDFCTKCVRIFPPVDVICNGQTIEGFYRLRNPIDITEMIVCDSGLFTIADLSQKESTCIFGFKESNDFQIERTQFNNQQLYDAVIATNGQSGETKEKRNPIFEPTMINEYPQYGGNINAIPHLPTLLDNKPDDEGNTDESFDLGKRIMCFANAPQFHESAGAGSILFNGQITNSFATGFHTIDDENFIFSSYTPAAAFIYGNTNLDDQTNSMFCKFRESTRLNSESMKGSFEIFLCPGECQGWSFRDLLCGTYNGKPFNIFPEELLANVCNDSASLQFEEEYKTCITAPDGGEGGTVRVIK